MDGKGVGDCDSVTSGDSIIPEDIDSEITPQVPDTELWRITPSMTDSSSESDFHVSAAVEFELPSNVPQEYVDLAEAFIKRKATELPPHRPYDCAIDLIPGMSPSRGALYSLSIPERKAMKDYVQEALRNGSIRPSTSPTGAGFFLLPKRMAV